MYVWTYVELRRALRRHLRRLLNLNRYLYLYLYLYLMLNPALNLALFEKPFERSNPLSFRSSLVLMNRSSLVLACLQPRRQTRPRGQSVGRPLHGRIVVPAVPGHYIWILGNRRLTSPPAAKRGGLSPAPPVTCILCSVFYLLSSLPCHHCLLHIPKARRVQPIEVNTVRHLPATVVPGIPVHRVRARPEPLHVICY